MQIVTASKSLNVSTWKIFLSSVILNTKGLNDENTFSKWTSRGEKNMDEKIWRFFLFRTRCWYNTRLYPLNVHLNNLYHLYVKYLVIAFAYSKCF